MAFFEPDEGLDDIEQLKAEETSFVTAHFLSKLRLDELRCNALSEKVAAFEVKGLSLQLSAVAVAVLRKRGIIGADDVTL